MTRLDWTAAGNRVYEAGVDRGVLYVGDQDGVSWSGLISVAESPSGGDATPYYIDGFKFLNVPSDEEFEATINAYTYPDAFAVCDGTARPRWGLFATQQPRQSFGLSYRTRIGNDLQGLDFGYKIHIIYNALAAPSQRSNKTLSDSADPSDFSWAITTRPVAIPGYRGTAHLVIDSRFTNPATLSAIEDFLYGNDMAAASLPSPTDLMTIFDDNATLVVTDNGDGTYTISSSDDIVEMLDSETYQITWPSVEFIGGDSYNISSL